MHIVFSHTHKVNFSPKSMLLAHGRPGGNLGCAAARARAQSGTARAKRAGQHHRCWAGSDLPVPVQRRGLPSPTAFPAAQSAETGAQRMMPSWLAALRASARRHGGRG